MLLALLACADPSQDSAAPTTPTWHRDIAPIVAERCAGCHTSGGTAPFVLDGFEAAAAQGEVALEAIEAGTMPPFDVYETETCAPSLPLKEDPRLSDDEKALFRAWVEAGRPEGDATTAAPLPDTTPPTLDRVDRELVAPSGYRTSGTSDEFMCFSVDAGVARDTWVTGVEVLPGNLAVNHHVVVTTDPHAESAGWSQDYVDCFSIADPTDGQPIAVWTPGADPMELPDDVGVPLPAGSRLVVQIHFHPAGERAEPDQTTIRLRLEDSEPAHQAFLVGVGNFGSEDEGLQPGPNDRRGEAEFRIPKNVAGHTETMKLTVQDDTELRVLSVMPHEHYIGTDMEVRWTHDGALTPPTEECLRSKWRFDWQRSYVFDAPLDELPILDRGSELQITCTYDNTLDNPWVRQALEDAGLDEPINVTLGEETLDEMCLAIFGIVI